MIRRDVSCPRSGSSAAHAKPGSLRTVSSPRAIDAHPATRTREVGRIAGVVVAASMVVVHAASLAWVDHRSDARTMAYISNADSRQIYVLELNERTGGSRVVQ
jgi:hypothetical protein